MVVMVYIPKSSEWKQCTSSALSIAGPFSHSGKFMVLHKYLIFLCHVRTKMPLKVHMEKICLVYQKDWLTGLLHYLDWFRFSLNMWSEAFRLLNKSIIRVETPDVNLDQEEDAQMEVDEGPDGINGEVSVHDCSRVRGQMFSKISWWKCTY